MIPALDYCMVVDQYYTISRYTACKLHSHYWLLYNGYGTSSVVLYAVYYHNMALFIYTSSCQPCYGIQITGIILTAFRCLYTVLTYLYTFNGNYNIKCVEYISKSIELLINVIWE